MTDETPGGAHPPEAAQDALDAHEAPRADTEEQPWRFAVGLVLGTILVPVGTVVAFVAWVMAMWVRSPSCGDDLMIECEDHSALFLAIGALALSLPWVIPVAISATRRRRAYIPVIGVATVALYIYWLRSDVVDHQFLPFF